MTRTAHRAGPASGSPRPACRQRPARGGRARRAAGKPRGMLFDDPACVLLTLLYQRQACSMNVLADLLEVTATIGDLVGETREVLQQDGRPRPRPSASRLHRSSSDLPRQRRPPTCPEHLTTTFSHSGADRAQPPPPARPHQATHCCKKRRGRTPQLPAARRPAPATARGGVFHQKISNDRTCVLLAILHQRHLCTMDVRLASPRRLPVLGRQRHPRSPSRSSRRACPHATAPAATCSPPVFHADNDP